MKKFILTTIVLAVILSVSGCSRTPADIPDETKSTTPVVNTPLAYPDYTFRETPDVEDLRNMAVVAMRDLLSIHWSPAESISYYNTAGRDKQFDYESGVIYGGLLYSGAGSGLFQYLEYYDSNTGLLDYPGDSDALRNAIGSGCADSLLWSWGTVANSFTGGYFPSMMVYKNGYYPVGDYKYNFDIKSYYQLSTKDIITNNGTNVIVDAYTKVLPADAFISSTSDHAMMVVEAPTIVYTDGAIDLDESYVIIQDQRGGRSSTTFYEEKEGQYTVFYNSQRAMKQTFTKLLEKNYIPVTIAEFMGTKAYDKAELKLTGGDCASLSSVKAATVESNYPIALIKVLGYDANGQECELEKVLFHGANSAGPARSYALGELDSLKESIVKNIKELKIEIVLSTGERFVPVELKL